MSGLERTASLLREIVNVRMWISLMIWGESLLNSPVSEWTLGESELPKGELIQPKIVFLLPGCLAFLLKTYVY